MELIRNKTDLQKEMPSLFVRFYLVGMLLFFLPQTRGIFTAITALSLVLVIGVIFFFHKNWNIKTILWFLFIMITSFLVEMAGVNTGIIFGHYQYGKAFIPQIEGTPLIIGLNWLFLSYASHDIARKLYPQSWFVIIAGASFMVMYDLLLEWVAPPMKMWSFEGAYPPFSNFVVWGVMALIYQCGFELLKIRSDNGPARSLFGIQMLFFIIIGFYSVLFNL